MVGEDAAELTTEAGIDIGMGMGIREVPFEVRVFKMGELSAE